MGRRRSGLVWIVGVAMVGGGAAFISLLGKGPDAEDVAAAKHIGVPVPDYELLRKLNRQNGQIDLSDGEWLTVSRYARQGPEGVQGRALKVLSHLPQSSRWRSDAIQIAADYLDQRHADGNVAPILVLRSMGDERWKLEATRLQQSATVENRELGNALLKLK